MFLHVLADTLGSVGVIVSSCLISWFGWVYADAICTMFIAGMILLSIVPLFKNTISILMQRLPAELDSLLYDAFQKVCISLLPFVCCANKLTEQLLRIENVVSHSEFHAWELCTDRIVGTIRIQIASHATNEQSVRFHVNEVFKQIGVTDLTVQVEKENSLY